MNPETRQTLIGVVGLTLVELMAIHEGFNGRVMMSYFLAVVALISPQAMDRLPTINGGQR